jgi:hypothetical protein
MLSPTINGIVDAPLRELEERQFENKSTEREWAGR